MPRSDLIIVGASARAAAFSADRSGYHPFWIDQFGDSDLHHYYPGRRVGLDDYPAGLVAALAAAPDAPWIYTGALENHLRVVEQLADIRPLLGNPAAVCAGVRDPAMLRDCLVSAGIPCAEISTMPPADLSQEWLLKSRFSAGGLGVSRAEEDPALGDDLYYQRFLAGESRAAIYLADGRQARLLGVTRQLTGVSALHAGEFNYCGSIGPLAIAADEQNQWQGIGAALVQAFGLRGLFGVDAIDCAGVIHPLEVNPRYTASMEVVELALQIPLISMHRQACAGEMPSFTKAPMQGCLGKAYLFAPYDLVVGDLTRRRMEPLRPRFPAVADIPAPGGFVPKEAPILTLLVHSGNSDGCMEQLLRNAGVLYRQLEGDE